MIAQYRTEFEAALVRNTLREAGIPCELAGIHTAGFRAEAPGWVQVLIPARFEARARALLVGIEQGDIEQGDIGQGGGDDPDSSAGPDAGRGPETYGG